MPLVVTGGGGGVVVGVGMDAMGMGMGIDIEDQADGITGAVKVGGACPRANPGPRITTDGLITLILEAAARAPVDMEVIDGAIYLTAFVELEAEKRSIICLFADWDASACWYCVVR
jgi:hypothetical protein